MPDIGKDAEILVHSVPRIWHSLSAALPSRHLLLPDVPLRAEAGQEPAWLRNLSRVTSGSLPTWPECCKPEFYQDPAWSSDTCDGDAIYCKDFSCESYGAQNCNYISIQNSGFSDYDGSYVITEFLEANRPVFQKDDSCVWDQQYKTFFANTDGTMFISSHLMNLTN